MLTSTPPKITTESDVIRNIPSPCDHSVPGDPSTAKYTRSDCIEYEYTRRCRGETFFGDKICTNLGLNFPGFAFAMLNDHCVSDAGAGSSKCNDWMNYIQMCANAPKSDSNAEVKDRKSRMGDAYNETNEDIGMRRYWLWTSSPSEHPNSGGSVFPSIDYTVGGRVPENTLSKYVSGAKPTIFYPVQYDAKMRSDVCDKPQLGTSTDAMKDPDEIFGWAAALTSEDAVGQVFASASYSSLQSEGGSISKDGKISLINQFPFKTKPKVKMNDSIEILPASMSLEMTLPKLSVDSPKSSSKTPSRSVARPSIPVSVGKDGNSVTFTVPKVIVDGIKKGEYYILIRHGGSGCRCLETASRISLGGANSAPIQKECLFSYCDTKRVQEMTANVDGSIQYPRQDYLSAVDGSLVTDFSFDQGNCPSSITVCSINLRAKHMIVRDTKFNQNCSSKVSPAAGNTTPGTSPPSPKKPSPFDPQTDPESPTDSKDPADPETNPIIQAFQKLATETTAALQNPTMISAAMVCGLIAVWWKQNH